MRTMDDMTTMSNLETEVKEQEAQLVRLNIEMTRVSERVRQLRLALECQRAVASAVIQEKARIRRASILSRVDSGETMAAVARSMGVTPSRISAMVKKAMLEKAMKT